MTDAEIKSKAIAMTMWQVMCRHGQQSITFAHDPCLEVNATATGLSGLDTALGIGGLPKGRIVEIHGDPGAGKTKLALHLARQVPAALYIDADYGITPSQGAGLYIAHPNTLEDALGICEVAATGFDMIVIDSLSALPTRADLESKIGDYPVVKSNAASILSRSLPRLSHALSLHGCTLVLITQLREKPRVMYGNPEFALGGRALKHCASVRLEVKRTEIIRQKRAATGQKMRIRVVKNKCGSPFKECLLEIMFDAPERNCLRDLPTVEEGSRPNVKYIYYGHLAARAADAGDN